ncbi:MAG: CoA-binding protein [Deltaproteobacteria bacterium]|nr:CoA-binding protein [Deltaproteobacteria bacterium]MBW2659627.1 CoA-binding protein [Deltaproteobacteria bacterium]
MQTLNSLQELSDIGKLLKQITSIAVVGLSPKESRPSNMVARYLIESGYKVIPVNPGQSEILGEVCYPDLFSVPEQIEIVDIFRRSEDVLPIVEQAVDIGARAVWMQQGIINSEAAELARRKGIFVVMDRCIKVDHNTLGL